MRLRIILILGFLAILSVACTPQASAPVTPVQIPTSVEYAGGDITGDISAQVSKSLSFLVKDEDGEIISDPPVTVEVFDPEGNPIDYGTVTINGTEIVYTVGQCLPNIPSWVTIEFSYEGAVIGISKVTVSVDPNSEYTFTDGVLISPEGGYADSPSLVAASDGTLYACYRAKTFSDEETCEPGRYGGPEVCYYPLLSSKLVIVKGVGSGNMCDGSYALEWTEIGSIENSDLHYSFGEGCKIAIHETDGDSNGYYEVASVAVAWPSSVSAEYTVEGRPDPIEYYIDNYEVAFSTDGGETFGDPIQLNTVDVTPAQGSGCSGSSPNTVNIAFDQGGILHAAYETVGCEWYLRDVYYARCSTSECGETTHLNSEDGSLGNTGMLPVAVSGDDPVKIYVVWEDSRDSEEFANLYMGEINRPSDGTAELIRNIRVDDVADIDWATAPNMVIDRDSSEPSLVVTWSGIDVTNLWSKIYMARWDEDEEAFGPSVVVSDVEEGYFAFFSHITADYSNTYHIIYSYVPPGWDESEVIGGIRYAVGTYSDSLFDLANSEDVFTGMEEDWTLTTVGDLPGRTYVFWVETDYEYNSEIYLAIGTQ